MKRALLLVLMAVSVGMCRLPGAHAAAKAEAVVPVGLRALQGTARYKLAWTRYRTRLPAMQRRSAEESRRSLRDEQARERARDAEISRDESRLLDTLRRESRTRVLSFTGECAENRALSTSSAASARIFWILLHEGRALDLSTILSMLEYCDARICARGWMPFLKVIVGRRVGPESTMAAACLYHLGDSRIAYRRCAEQLAAGGDTQALRSILYRQSPRWLAVPLRSKANAALVDRLFGSRYSPEIRVLCAGWLADTGQRARAENLCRYVLWQPVDDIAGLSTDDAVRLCRAQSVAWDVLFDKVKTESAFLHAYAFGSIAYIMDYNPRLLPVHWRRSYFSGYANISTSGAKMVIGLLLPDDEYAE